MKNILKLSFIIFFTIITTQITFAKISNLKCDGHVYRIDDNSSTQISHFEYNKEAKQDKIYVDLFGEKYGLYNNVSISLINGKFKIKEFNNGRSNYYFDILSEEEKLKKRKEYDKNIEKKRKEEENQEENQEEKVYTFLEKNNIKLIKNNKGERYIKIDGNLYGPYNNTSIIKRNDKTYFSIEIDSRTYYGIIINKDFSDFIFMKSIFFNKNGNWKSENTIWKDGIQYGPYSEINVNKIDNLTFFFLKDKHSYYYINGKIYGPYARNTNTGLYNLSNNGFAIKYSNNGKYYININGNIYNINGNIIYENGYIDFTYTKNNLFYKYIDGKIYGPYEKIEDIKRFFRVNSYTSYTKKYFFIFIKNGEKYIFNNDRILGPFPIGSSIEFYGKLSQNISILYKKEGKSYVNMNGSIYGPYDEVQRYSNYGKSGFLRAKTIGEDGFAFYFIMYKENKKNKKYPLKEYYYNINGNIYGPLNPGKVWNLRENGFAFDYTIRRPYLDNKEERKKLYEQNKYKNPLKTGYIRTTNVKYVNINGKVYGPYEDDEIFFRNVKKGIVAFTHNEPLNTNNKIRVVSRYKDFTHEEENYCTVKGLTIVKTTPLKTKINNNSIKEKETIKSNQKIDNILNKFFIKVDKKGEEKAQVLYKKVISKIDFLIKNSKNNKKIELLKYIKRKIIDKITK